MEQREYQAMYELEDHHWWFLGKRAFIDSVLPMPRGGWHVLDLGAGTGGLSRWLGRWGRVTRVESSPFAQTYLRKHHLRYHSSDVARYPGKSNFFDLVCLCDVLYHKNVIDEHLVLKNAYRMLKPGGLLLVTDSAVPWLFSTHDRVMHGKKRYWLNELSEVICSIGYRIEKHCYIYCFVFPFTLVVRLIAKRFFIRSVASVHPILNAFFLSLCRLEASMTPYIKFPIGSSVIVVGRKPL